MNPSQLITRIYADQRINSKRRKHNIPNYSKQELTEWLYDNGFESLYKIWQESNFDKYLKPSIDRLNNKIGYDFNNIQLSTWGDNKCKEHSFIKTPCIVIEQLIDNKVLNTYSSMMEAQRRTGIHNGNISKACRTNNRAGGFYWRYKEEY